MIPHIRYDIPKLERVTSSDGSRLYNTPSGLAYPSVTTVTGLLKKQAIIEWRNRVGHAEANRISARAAARGTRIHSLCEAYLNGEHVVPNMFDQQVFNSLKPLLDEIEEVHALETPLFSNHLKVAGTVDCVAKFRGKMTIVDFKTSTRIKFREDITDYFMQCAAYAVAFEEQTGVPVPRLAIMMGIDNEEPILFEEKRDTWINGFIDLREQYASWKGV